MRLRTLWCVIGLASVALSTGCSSAGQDTAKKRKALAPYTQPLTMVLDSSIDDWPADQVVAADEYFLYLRFSPGEAISLQSNNESVVVALDIDGNVTTGLPSGELGVDLEITFSPPRDDGTPGNGTVVSAISPDGERITLAPALLDISVAPSCASEWFEMRIARRTTIENLFPIEGLFSSGRLAGRLAMFTPSGKRVAEAPLFETTLPPASDHAKRVRANIPAKPLGTVRIVSHNVLNGSPLQKPEPFARLLRALDPDIVVVQEWYDTPADEMAAWFNDNLAINGRWRAVTTDARGVAVISRLDIAPIGPPAVLVQARGEERTVRVTPALVETPIGPIAVASVHLKCCGGLGTPEDEQRIIEAGAIASMINDQTKDIGPHVRVVMGDFNLVGSKEPLYTLARGFDVDGSNATIAEPFVMGDNAMYTWTEPTSRFLPSRLDYAIYSDSSAVVARTFVFDPARLSLDSLETLNIEEIDAMASDHRPIVLDLRAP
ncbi:MAG: endonuclease/exonuclease/phosphatase family protein [Phycisphaerales bacterium]|nr:endonuclease/exonuclease/phosphatase family protein [Phycisphaerales bacterium]MCB9835228.1 endonuclease/exonuclease/phosphatase family protein [Phycisphaera sp.]